MITRTESRGSPATATASLVIAGWLAVGAGCGNSADGQKSSPTKLPATPEPATKPMTIDVAPINALVPTALKDKLVFEQRQIVIDGTSTHKDTFSFAAPRTWERDRSDPQHARLQEPGHFAADMMVERLHRPETDHDVKALESWFELQGKGTVLVDERGDDSRSTILYEAERCDDARCMSSTPSVTKVRVLTHSKSTRPIFCHVDLREADKDAAPAFAKACMSAIAEGGE